MVKLVLGLLCLLSSLGTLGFFIYTEGVYERPLPSEEIERKKLLEEETRLSYPESFKLEKMIINLRSRTTRLRFLDVKMYLVPFKGNYGEILSLFRPQIHDIIIEEAGGMTPKELNSIHGKILLENRIKGRINEALEAKVVREIQFTRFTVQ